ncbi:MAG: hypothetical protein A4E19_07325 [Nitrospira sp. SG-bin1]|nr:MAG: hypothetical protein A4E19_07325 [Nitrospira sp. SG-bin1]
MSAPPDTDSSLSAELVRLRRQVSELQQALTHAQYSPAPANHLSALGAAQIGAWEWEGRTDRVIWSSETEQIFGLLPGSFDGTYAEFFTRVHPEDRQRLSAAIAKAVEDRTPYRIEHRIIRQDGAVRWVACRGRATFRDDEPVTGMVGTIEDITGRKQSELAQQDMQGILEAQVRERTAGLEQVVIELKREVERRQQAESALKASEQRYQSLYEQNPFMYFTLSADGTVLSVNRFGADQLGYRKEDLLHRSILNVFDPNDRATVLEQLTACAADPYKLFEWKIQKIRKDGSRLWVKERARAIHDETGRILVLVFCEDVTARNVTESLLRESEHAIRSFQEATAAPGLTFEQRMQTILELGCRRFKLPIGMLTRVAGDQLEVCQVWPSVSGLTAGTLLPLSQSYCRTTLQASGPTSVEHAGASEWSRHPGYAALGFECYLGTKLAGRHKHHGTICFVGPDPYPEQFSDADKAFLQLMARWIAGELDRQDSEQALRASELKFRTLVETTRDWVWEVNEQAVYTYASPRIREILGYEPEEVIGKTLFDLMPPDEAARVADLFGPIAAACRPFTLLEHTNRHKNGRLIVLETSGTPIFDGAGNFLGYHGIDRDITDRKRTEEALRKSEERFEIAFRSSPYPVIMTELESGRCLEVNEASLKLFGYTRTEVIDRTTLALGLWPSPDDRARFFRQLEAEGAIKNRETRLCTKDKKILTLLVSSEVIELNGVACLITVGNDITEHTRAEEALRASELRLQRFLAEAPVGLCILDDNWRAISANKALCELTGYEEHEIVGSTYALYTHPDDLAANIALTDEFFRGVRSDYTYEKRYIRKSGEIIWVCVKAIRVELSGHAGPLLLAAVQDITERKLAMEEREHLSRDLHDNILQALYAVGMQLEAGKLSMGKSLRRSKIHITHAVDQLNNLMLDVRRFIALLTQRATAELDFGQALRQLIASMSGAGQSAPELEIVNPVLSFITPKVGEQLLNIAREALSNSARHARASQRWVQLRLADNAIRLTIGDDGVGFSTKRKRRAGHGLGNMAARAQQISATFTLETAPGKGTSVLVDVPLKKGNVYE